MTDSKFNKTSRDLRNIKISCRNVWKIYGDNPDQYFNGGRETFKNNDELKAHIQSSGHIPAACDINFDVKLGEIFVIMGLSGSGKSTTVRCLSRLVEPTAGEVLLDGINLLEISDRELIEIRRHKMGMVFQNFGLLPHQTVLENVAFPLKVQGVSRSEREEQALKVIELVGLEGREESYPRELSGGQQQRVGFARSLAVDPEIWLLDEPFSALDPLIRRQMQDEFLQLERILHKTIVFITHDFMEAIRIADRVAIMKDGWMVQIGTPAEIVMNPANDYVAEFTQDVPRVKVLTVGDIFDPVINGLDRSFSVPKAMTLEEVMPRFAGNEKGIVVVDENDEVCGRITPIDVVNALATDLEQ